MRLLLFVFLFLPAMLRGQAPQGSHPAYPYSATIYYDAADAELPTPAGAAYWLRTTYVDSVGAVVRRYYPSGKLKEYTPYANLRYRILHGTVSTWYENGQMHTKEEYLGGLRQGQLLVYYPDGTLQRHDTYEAGHNRFGTCFGPNGQPVPYIPYEQLPLYPGGDAWLSKEVLRQVRLSAAERLYFPYVFAHLEQTGFAAPSNTCIGKVKVDFTVAEDGTVRDVAVAGSSMAASVNEKVLTAVRRLRRFKPGQRNGMWVETKLELLLSFDIYALGKYPRPARL